MRWIESVERLDDQWGVLVSGCEGSPVTWYSVSTLRDHRPVVPTTSHHTGLTTNFSDWTLSSPETYLEAFGHRPISNKGHLVFSFQSQGTEFLIPAIALIRALFRPLDGIAPWLFHPAGLELVSAPITIDDDCGLEVKLTCPVRNHWARKSHTVRQFLRWVWAYPSAGRMWRSVLAHAQERRLGLDLPVGQAKLSCHGIATDRYFGVTSLRFKEVVPEETAVLPIKANVIRLDETTPTPHAIRADAEIKLLSALGANFESISDHSWNQVAPLILNNGYCGRRRHDQRAILNDVLRKLASGRPWRTCSHSTGSYLNAAMAYHGWRVRGVWDRICEGLTSSLEQTSSICYRLSAQP